MGLFRTKQERLNRSLLKACIWDKEERLERALAEGADVNAKDADGDTGLARAAANGYLPIAERLLQAGADVNSRNHNGHTPLFAALDYHRPDLALLLLEKGADPNAATSGGMTVLMEACANNMKDAAGVLLQRGADVNTRKKDNWTALHYAAANGRFAIARLLLEKGADPGVLNDDGNRPEDLAQKNGHPGLASFLREIRVPPVPGGAAQAGWILTGPDEVAFKKETPGIDYGLTEIFNFSARTYTCITRNLKTSAESQSLRFFDEFPDKGVLERAYQQLAQLGGKAEITAVYGRGLDKKPGL